MKRYYIPCALDGALTFLFSGVAAYTVFLSFGIGLLSSAVLAAGLAFFIAVGVFAISLNKRSGLSLKDDAKRILATMNILNVCTADEILRIFLPVFNNMHILASVTGEHIRLDGGKVIIPAFMPCPVTANQLKMLVSPLLVQGESAIVLSAEFDDSAQNYAQDVGVKLFFAKDVYTLLKDNGALPTPKKEEGRRGIKVFFGNLFQRKNAVKLIVYGSIIITTAFFTPYPAYYYIFGGAFVLCGALSLIFSPTPAPKQKTA